MNTEEKLPITDEVLTCWLCMIFFQAVLSATPVGDNGKTVSIAPLKIPDQINECLTAKGWIEEMTLSNGISGYVVTSGGKAIVFLNSAENGYTIGFKSPEECDE